MSLLAGTVVGGFGLFLIGLTGVVFLSPALAELFFRSFASSARAHYTEQAVRLVLGTAIVAAASVMWPPGMFYALGWTIVVSAVGVLVVPWQWHRRLADVVMPLLLRHIKLYAVGLFAFGVFLLFGLILGKP